MFWGAGFTTIVVQLLQSFYGGILETADQDSLDVLRQRNQYRTTFSEVQLAKGHFSETRSHHILAKQLRKSSSLQQNNVISQPLQTLL